MFRNGTTDSVASDNLGQAAVVANVVHVCDDGGSQAGFTTTPEIALKDTALATAAESSTSMLSTSPISMVPGSDTSCPSSMGRTYSLRRSGSNIANLRATFENNNAPETPVKRFEKSPSRKQDAEVARLERQLASEIEARQFLQSKLEAQLKIEVEARKSSEDALKLDLERETQSRRVYQAKCEKLERELESGQAQRSNAEETQIMQRQLYELKRSISTATRTEHQVSDSTLAQEIANLAHELQNFMVNTFRRVKLSKTPEELCERLETVAAPKQLLHLLPLFRSFESSVKLAALQTTAVCYIMDIFEEPLLFGLPQQEWRDDLGRTVKTLPAILAPPMFNRWRYLTLDAVRQSGSIEESVDLAASRVSEMICVTLSALTDAEDLSARASSLKSIVMRVVQLSHLFRVQRAQYEFHLPAPGTLFQPDLMEDPGADSDSPVERSIAGATFPFVIKHGDENGDNLHLSNVVAKAKVFCKA